MTRQNLRPLFAALCLISICTAAALWAQNPKRPQAYSLTMTFMGTTMEVYHIDGKERVDLDTAAGMLHPKEVHQILFFDSEIHKAFAEDPVTHACYTSPYPTADDLSHYDPLLTPPREAGSPDKVIPGAKLVGTRTINGLTTELYEGAQSKLWWSGAYDIPIKMEMALSAGSAPTTMEEIKQLVATAPPASLFAEPTGCKETQGTWDPDGFVASGETVVTLGAVTPKPQASPLASPSSLPTQYTLTVVSTATDASFVTGRPATLKVYRNGSKERVDVTLPPGGGGSGYYGVYLFDFSAQKVYMRARVGNSALTPWSCMKYPDTEARYGDDPVTDSADIWKTMTEMGTVKEIGAETLNGIPTEVQEVNGDGFLEKIWTDHQRGFIVKYSMLGGAIKKGFEVKQMSFAAPPASLLATPASCQYTGEWCRSGFCGGTGSTDAAPSPKPKQ